VVKQLPLIVQRVLLYDGKSKMHYLTDLDDLADALREHPQLQVVPFPERIPFEDNP
jgi:quinolinate synthase